MTTFAGKVIARIRVPCKGNNGNLNNHRKNRDDERISVPSTVKRIREQFLEVVQRPWSAEIERKGNNVAALKCSHRRNQQRIDNNYRKQDHVQIREEMF